MESKSNQPPLICIVGETASGKTDLAIKLAQQFNGEIIAADSRTIYRGMDIGTAKPTPAQQLQVRHHMIDVAEVGQLYTVADFKQAAELVIRDIARRGKLPMLVGGNGLYVDALIYDFSFRGKPDLAERERLQQLSTAELQRLVQERGIPMPTNPKNPRHLIGALETGSVLRGHSKLRENTLLLSLRVPREELARRIASRTMAMIEAGLEAEVRALVDIYGWGADILDRCIGYMEFKPYFVGRASIEEVVRAIETHTRQLAKRQRTWFRRNPHIHYPRNYEETVDVMTTFLNKVSTSE